MGEIDRESRLDTLEPPSWLRIRLLGQAKANAAAVVEGSSPQQLEVLCGEALLSGALFGKSRLSKLYEVKSGDTSVPPDHWGRAVPVLHPASPGVQTDQSAPPP